MMLVRLCDRISYWSKNASFTDHYLCRCVVIAVPIKLHPHGLFEEVLLEAGSEALSKLDAIMEDGLIVVSEVWPDSDDLGVVDGPQLVVHVEVVHLSLPFVVDEPARLAHLQLRSWVS